MNIALTSLTAIDSLHVLFLFVCFLYCLFVDFLLLLMSFLFCYGKVPEAEFEGQTKNRLGNPEVIAPTTTTTTTDTPTCFATAIACPCLCLPRIYCVTE